MKSVCFYCFISISNMCLATENGVKLPNRSVLIPLTNITEKISNGNKTVLSLISFYFLNFGCLIPLKRLMPLYCLMITGNSGGREGKRTLTLHFCPTMCTLPVSGKMLSRPLLCSPAAAPAMLLPPLIVCIFFFFKKMVYWLQSREFLQNCLVWAAAEQRGLGRLLNHPALPAANLPGTRRVTALKAVLPPGPAPATAPAVTGNRDGPEHRPPPPASPQPASGGPLHPPGSNTLLVGCLRPWGWRWYPSPPHPGLCPPSLPLLAPGFLLPPTLTFKCERSRRRGGKLAGASRGLSGGCERQRHL